MQKKIMNSVVIAAGGSGSRMGSEIPKQFLPLCGVPVVVRTLKKFERCTLVDEIIIVTNNCYIDHMQGLVESFKINKVTVVTEGGRSRQESVMNGLKYVRGEYVFVHDAARPLVTEEQIERVILAAHKFGAAALGISAKDTLKEADEENVILSTIDRVNKFLIQTPQGAKTDVLYKAHKHAAENNISVTDDCALLELNNQKVKIIDGSALNLKLTTPDDMILAEGIIYTLCQSKNEDEREKSKMRVGFGYDVHKLVENRDLIIGGVKIPYELGLLGHSDADVLLHAISDALLGAAALGDIGKHFPDTDDKWKGADSLKLLSAVGSMLTDKGFKVINIDATIIAQKPKMVDYIVRMREKIAEALKLSVDDVSIKATTTEKLGFCGRGEGIAAEAICMIDSI